MDIMVDKVEQFVLSLKGYPYKGHMKYWALEKECFGWIENNRYSLITEPWFKETKVTFIENRIVLLYKCHYTLGTKVNYMKLMELVAEKEKGKYYDPNFTVYKINGWPN